MILPEVLYKLGFSYSQQSNTLEALKALESLLQEFPRAVESQKASFLVANINYGLGNAYLAADFYRRITDFFPEGTIAPFAQYRLAVIHFKNQRYSEASLEFNQFIISYPRHELIDKVRFSLAFSHYLAKESKVALAAFSDFIKNTPANHLTLEAQYLLSLEAENSGNLNQALEYLKNIEEVYPQNPYKFEIKMSLADFQIDNSLLILSEFSKEEYHSEAANVFRENSQVIVDSLRPFSEMLKVTIDQLRKKHLKKLQMLVIDFSFDDKLLSEPE